MGNEKSVKCLNFSFWPEGRARGETGTARSVKIKRMTGNFQKFFLRTVNEWGGAGAGAGTVLKRSL